MIEKIKERFGENAQILGVQEYFANQWIKYNSNLSVTDQISECIGLGATVLSFHITTMEEDAESGETKIVDAYPDVSV